MTSTTIDRDTECQYCGFPRHAHWGARPLVEGRCPGFKAAAIKPDAPMRSALEAAEHWIEEQAWSPIAENGEILRVIRAALGKPHAAPDAPPAAPAADAKPRLVIVIDDGCVTDVVSDDAAIIGMPYATLDHDTDGMQQDDEVRLIPQAEGEPREGYIREHVVTQAEFPIGPASTYELAPAPEGWGR